MKRFLLSISITVVLATLSGCMSVSGLDAKSSFSCKAPDGVLCESMSGIYANAEQHNLPGQRVHHSVDSTDPVAPPTAPDSVVFTKPISSGTPLRSAPRVLRVWFAPWEDTDGDLHDQSYVYLAVDAGHWLVEHHRRRIQNTYKPVQPSAHADTTAPVTSSIVEENASDVRTGSEHEVTEVGVVQSRPSAQGSAAMPGDIQMPGQVIQFAQP